MSGGTGGARAAWLLAAVVVATRLALLAPDCGGVSPDTGNYLLALDGFAPGLARPHLPASWAFVAVLRLLAVPLGGYGALLVWAVGCSAAAAGLALGLLRRWFPPRTAWLLTLAVATQPVVWFYGIVPEVYGFDLLAGVALARLGAARRGPLLLPWVLALVAALRPTTAVLLLPLAVVLARRAPAAGRRGRALLASWAGAAALLAAAWAPTLAAAGGVAAYLELVRTGLTVDWNPLRNLWGLSLFLATLGVTVAALLAAARVRPAAADARPAPAARRLLAAWLLPGALFFVLGHHQKGYALLVVVPLLALLAGRIAPRARDRVLVALVALQAVYFVAAPYRWPPPEIFAAPDVRRTGLVRVWAARVASTHLMAAARPRALAAADAELAAILAAAPADTVFLDPTFPLFLRAVQVRHPGRAFAALDLQRPDGWRLHAGRAERGGTGVARMLARSLVVTRRATLTARPCWAAAVPVHEGARLAALRPDPSLARCTAADYAARFLRRRE